MFRERASVETKADRERINEADDDNSRSKQMHSAALSKTNDGFCSLPGNEYLCEVEDDYILDDFNLCGLSHQVPYYEYALDEEPSSPSHGDVITKEQNELIESAAEMLYGLIHARYILTCQGLAGMVIKYEKHHFGRCPRVYCQNQICLPLGLSDIPRASTVKLYCPKCEDVYTPQSNYQANMDGAYFGTTFTHLFMMTFYYIGQNKASQSYVPRVFGFKLHKALKEEKDKEEDT